MPEPRPPGAGDLVVRWRPRPQPLDPLALAVAGEPARRLVRRLVDERRWNGLGGVAAGEVVVLLADDGADLPWARGGLFLGKTGAAPSLLLPTALEPSVPASWLQAAAVRLGLDLPQAVLPRRFLGRPAWLSLTAARPLGRAALERWLATAPGP